MNGLKKQNLSKQQKIVYIVMISGLLLLITANIFAWLYLQRLKTFFISDLKFRLENIARSASELIDANDLELIIPGDDSDSQVLYYQQLLYNIKINNKLQDIHIISPGLDLLVNTDQVFDTVTPSPAIDNSVIERALQGEYAVGEMAAAVAHEIRNPLSIIKGANTLINK